MLVPVVGPDVTMVKVDDAEQTFNSVIGQRLAERFGLTVPGLTTMDEAVAEFLRERGRDEVDRLYRVINDIIVELDPAPGDALRDLAASDDLRLFVSTTPDRLLAQAVNEVRSPCRGREITLSPTWARTNRNNAQAPAARYHRSQSVWSSRLNSRVRDPRGGPNGVAAVLALRPGEPS